MELNCSYKVKRYTQDSHPESHFHEFYEVFISLSDKGKFFVGERAYPLSVGTVFFLQPFEIHHCFCHGDQDYDRYIIQFTREHLQTLSTKMTDLVTLFNSALVVQQLSDELLANLLGKLASLAKPVSNRFGADIERNIRFDLFLLALATTVNFENDIVNLQTEHDNRVNSIISYIHQHYTEELTLEELSGKFYISKSRLSKIFRNTTGFSVGNYILIYRIKRACILLGEGESVQNVGRMVGFKNTSHFIRMFKKQVGCPPGRFAKNSEGSEHED